jgi:Domain of unknown function (DUF5916)/AMIN domain
MNKRIGTLISVFLFVTAVCVTSAFASPTTTLRTTSQLRSVRLRPADGSIQVVFGLSGGVRHKSTRTVEPSRITIELPQTGISPVFTKRELLSVHPALIRVLITRSTGATRAVLDLAAAGAHTVYAASDELIVEIKTRTPAANPRIKPAPLAASTVPSLGVGLPGGTPQMPDLTFGPPETTLKIPWVPLGPSIEDFTSPNKPPVGARVSNFRQREPGDGSPISEETTTYVSYDSEHLYAVFVCRNERSDVRSHLVPRDAITEDDQVALYLDTFDDGRHAYVFASNPFGVQQDGVISDGDDLSYTADMLWRSQGRVTSDGFVVVMAIPFKSLRFAAGSDQSWRIAVGRTIAHRSESAFWPYITRRVNGFVRQMAALDGLQLISPGRNVQLTPYGTFARAQSFDPGPVGNALSEFRSVGLDAKVVIKNAVTIDAAVRPDFSEVESDDPLVRVNQRFELFVPEKRPFFMENAGLFDTPIKVFFSRRIADPEIGIRVTGRSTGWALGGLMANDRGIALDGSRSLFGQGARIGAARVQRLFGERSSVGVLATERDDGQATNRMVSMDGRLQMTPAWSFLGQAIHSEDQDQGSERETGVAYAAAVSRRGPHFTYASGYRDIGRTVRVPLGFVPRRDIRVTDHYAGYVWRVGDSGAWSFGPAVNAVIGWDHTSRQQDRWTNADLGLSHGGHLDLHVSRAEGYELFGTTPFRTNTTNVSASSSVFRWLSVWSLYSSGAAINYTPPAGVAPFLGANQGVYASVTLRPSAWLDVEQMVLHQQLETRPGARSPAKETVFNTNIFRWKANLQMSRSLALRGIVDYNRLDSDAMLFSEPDFSGLMYDLLVKYLLHPGTAVYVGFNKQYAGAGIDQGATLPFRWTSLPGRPVGQQIFVKMSYLLRF